MNTFIMNGYLWHVQFVNPTNHVLTDRSGERRVATTDPDTLCVYLSWGLYGDFLTRVLTHELGHVAMFSYHLVDSLHRIVQPEYWVDIEEWVCNFIADYGEEIREIVSRLLLSHKLQVL